MTQKDTVKARLLRYGKVDNLTAITRLYILRLGSIINRLRNEGMKIKTGYLMKEGKKTKICVYTLIK